MTQFELARRIGTRERNIQRWESGQTEPSGVFLVRIMALCPDEESLALFGLGRRELPAGLSTPRREASIKRKEKKLIEKAEDIRDPEVREIYRRIERGLQLLEAEKRAGNRAAAEMLDSIAETIGRAAALSHSPDLPRGRRKKSLLRLLREASAAEGLKRIK